MEIVGLRLLLRFIKQAKSTFHRKKKKATYPMLEHFIIASHKCRKKKLFK